MSLQMLTSVVWEFALRPVQIRKVLSSAVVRRAMSWTAMASFAVVSHRLQCNLVPLPFSPSQLPRTLAIAAIFTIIQYLHNNTLSQRPTKTLRSNDTLVDTSF